MQIDKRAFTLIELIIVVAIISISYSLVVPNIKNSTTDSVNLLNLKEYLLSLNFDKRASIVCFEDDKECSIYLDNRVLKHKISLFHGKIYTYKIAPNDELIAQEFSDIIVDGFSKRYNLKKLVYYEVHDKIYEAIKREKQLKSWKRDWKDKLIADFNSNWIDLYDEVL